MGLANKVKPDEFNLNTQNKEVEVVLENFDIEFIQEKLKTATYTGNEFEMFYRVWVKLAKLKS
jgi:hypothetical protein